MKKYFDKIKSFVDIWKMWIFFAALVGTNAGQQVYYSEPAPEPVIEKPEVIKPIKPKKPTIIYKLDIKLVEKLIKKEIEKHLDSSRH